MGRLYRKVKKYSEATRTPINRIELNFGKDEINKQAFSTSKLHNKNSLDELSSVICYISVCHNVVNGERRAELNVQIPILEPG